MKKHQLFQASRSLLVLVLLFSWLLAFGGCNRKSSEERFQELSVKAKEFIAQEKWEEARLTLLSASELRPEDAEPYFQLGEVFLRLQRPDLSVENYQAAINYNPNHRDARLHLGAILLAGREFERAEDQARKLMEVNPEDPETLLLMANIESSSPRKNFAEARRIFEGVLKKDPKSVGAVAGLGGLAMQEGDTKGAEELFLKAAALDPKNGPIQMVLADLYARQGRLDDSQEVVETILKEDPQNTGLRLGLGEFLLKRGLPDKATGQYEEVLKTKPEQHDARDRLYDIMVVRKNADNAKALTADLKKRSPESAAIAYFEGRDLELDGKMKEALPLYLKAISGLNNFAPSFRRAAIIEASQGDIKSALEHFNQAVAIDPGDIGARLALARFAMGQQKLAEATEHVNNVLQRFPRQLGANVLRADLALLEGKTAEARKVYQYLIDNFPNGPIGYMKLALLEEKDKNYDRATELYRKVLSFNQNVAVPAQRLAGLLALKNGVQGAIREISKLAEKSGASKPEYQLVLGSLSMADSGSPDRLTKARDYFNASLEGNPNMLAAYFALAAIDSQEGNTKSAIENYEKLVKQRPEHTPSLMLLGLLYEKEKDYEAAANSYQKILDRSPRFGPAANNLAWITAEFLKRDLDGALKNAQLAKEVMPAEATVTDTLGWIHFKRGSAEVALGILTEATELDKKAGEGKYRNPEILYHLAVVQEATGNKDAAKRTVKEALELSDEKAPIRKELEELRAKLG